MPASRVEAHLRAEDPDDHLIEVRLTLPPAPRAGERTLTMPRWIPGSYKIRDFARFVQDVEVRQGGRALTVRRDATDGWTFRDAGKGALTVRYKVYCRDLTVDTSHVTASHLYVHGVTAFLYDAPLRGLPWRVTVEVPKGWRIWTGLPEERGGRRVNAPKTPATGKAVLLADDYDHLVDCPVEAGPDHHEERFIAAGRPHRIVVWNTPERVDWKQVVKDIRGIVEEAAGLFGGLPYTDYTFICHIAKGHGGGLEHKNSTVLGVDPLHLTDAKLYGTRFLPLVAHEFFHVWNVRRIQPAVFQPFDYQREVSTGLLWLFEGGTSYYEIPLLLRGKVGKPEHAYETLAEMVKFLEAVPGRFRLSASDASRLTWTKLYQRHECNINTNVSYYSKGALVAFCLDAHLRKKGSSLDVVMRRLWKHHSEDGRGVPEGGVPAIVKEATGIDVTKELRAWVERPGDLPLDDACKTLGLKLKRDPSDPESKLGLGIQLADDTLRITSVPDRWETKDGKPRGKAAVRKHPLDPDDELVAIGGWKVTQKDLGKYVNSGARRPGDTIPVTVFRDGRLLTLDVPLVEKEKDKIKIEEDKKATAAAKKRRTAWKRKLARKS